jgi:hypothetical protein
MNKYIKKKVQQGGSSWALNNCLQNRDRLNLFICDTSDVQVTQVVDRLLKSGVPSSDLVIKDEVNKYSIKDKELYTKIIIINKHPTYADRIALILSLARKHHNGTVLYWDESDYDSPFYDLPDENSNKDIILTALASHCKEVVMITATVAGLGLSETDFGGVIELDKPRPKDKFLEFKDLENLPIDKDYLIDFLSGNKLTDPKIEDFLTKYQSEGILIRANHLIEGMENIHTQLTDKGFKTSVLAGNSYVDPTSVKDILISYKMALRGITFPNMHHMVLALPKNPTFADLVQLLRILGWNKKLDNNYVMCSIEDWQKIKDAHTAEEIYKQSLELYADNHVKRHAWLKEQSFPQGLPLPNSKLNGWKRKTKHYTHEPVGNKIPYSPQAEEILNIQGQLAEVITTVPNTEDIKWSGRSFEKIISDMINQSPGGKARLERGDVQRVRNGQAIKRIKTKEELVEADLLYGLVFEDNEWFFQQWRKIVKTAKTRMEK